MKKLIPILLVLVLALSAFALAACAPEETPPVDDNPEGNGAAVGNEGDVDGEKLVLTMGTEAGFEPFEYKEGDNYLGIDIELAQAIADKLNMELQISDMAFDTLLDALNADMVDFVAAGMSIDPEREQQVDFTVPYFNASQAVVIRAADAANYTDVTALEGKKIAVQAGTTGNDLADLVKDADVSAFTAYSEAISALENGSVDAVIMDNFPASSFAAGNEALQVIAGWYEEEQYAMAIKKGNTELYDQINGALQELIDDGTLDAIVERYSSDLM